ncbi:MAG: hypothetical protein VW600_06385 [Ferrovibrio sp.]
MLLRALRTLTFAAIVLLPPLLQAQPAPSPAQPGMPDLARGVAVLKGLNEAELGKTFDKYATMAGAWYLEQRCKPFAPNLRQEFEWTLAQMTVMLGQIARREFLQSLQQAARQTADKYACSDEVTNKIVLPAFADAKIMVKMLTGAEYSSAAGSMSDFRRVAILMQGQAIDNQCKYMMPELRAEYDGNIEAIIARLEQHKAAASLAGWREKVAEMIAANPVTCDRPARERLLLMLTESRAMVRQ